ncbi:MAG: hypothetical protein AVO39_10305 [delta proteobacterium MLS_D]|jgi:hypothetical protein|nr:MAG: hypothetical protein AVO39_10305 [delta proteobacterium MLS_D]
MTEDELEEHIELYKQLTADYSTVFRGEGGDRVLKDLGLYCNERNHCLCATDRETFFALGQRSVYLHILDMLEGKPLEMIQKYTKEVDYE